LPVVKRGNEAQIVQACVGTAPFWAHVKKLKLTRNMRLETAQGADSVNMAEFMSWQMCIGNGVDGHGEASEKTEFPSDMIVQTEEELIDLVFPDPNNPGTDCAILAP
jgi:hypothetical protein